MSAPALRFYDHHPAPANSYQEVLDGLSAHPRRIPPKFFYDERGSELFARICQTAEYYPTRTEMRILRERAPEIAERIGRGCVLIEPGSGSCEKVGALLQSLRPSVYVPVDISGDYLRSAAECLARSFPWLEVHAACADFTRPLRLPGETDCGRRVAFFPGSSIGNFEPYEAVAFLANLAELVGADGGLLIGVDLKKDPAVLNAAYNDARGITAAFNRNLLVRINRELGANFQSERFLHRAFYNAQAGRIEMHLVSDGEQIVRVDGHPFRFRNGEHIHTESSYKYTVKEFATLARRAGFVPRADWTDSQNLFSVQYFDVA